MIRNSDVFAVDPTGRKLPNDGVATLDVPRTDAEREVLKYELQQFVAEGEYREGLQRILRSYLNNLDRNFQPAVWVSGFYGSGKSHFMRVLLYLWTNPTIDGQSARSLVHLPPEVTELLKEIDSVAKRARTVKFAAAGIMRSGGGPMGQPLLEILLASAGLPTQYAPAKFSLWLREEGVWQDFLDALQRRGKDADEVSQHLFASTAIRQALLEVLPDWAPDAAAAGTLLNANFRVKDVSDDMIIDTIKQVLERVAEESDYGDRASMPLTLLVLDELQQYIGDDVRLLLEMQNLIERLSRQFRGRLLVVAAGQSALAANEVLARFQDRFSIRVQLQSKDVETVVREVVLRKKPEMTDEVQQVLDSVSGEVSRHLGGTKLAASPADRHFAVQDYPLLPTRRRFMEKALRAVDRGAAGQLRSQLRVILGATGHPIGHREPLARLPLGNVIPADFIYQEKKEDMLNQGVIIHDLSDKIDDLDDGTPDGELRARAVQLIFLIEHLDEAEGVRPTADTLADLLVTDLNAGSAALRSRLPAILDSTDLLVREGEEYRLLSDEDREWNRAYIEKRKSLEIDTSEQYLRRSQAITHRFEADARVVKVLQGVTNTPRKWVASIGEQTPEESESDLTVWVRNGWETDESVVRATVAELGMDSPVVTVFIPKQQDQEFKSAIAEWRAAAHVVATQPAPTTEGGQRARDAMTSRAKRAEDKVAGLADTVVARARVFLGGGEEIGASGNLQNALREALQKAAVRKFPRFQDADHNGWPTVFKRAKEGNTDPLGAVGHQGEAGQHPVVREIKQIAGPEGQPGSKVVKELGAAPFGWSRDVVLGALAALVGAQELVASEAGHSLGVADLTQANMGKLTYRVATVVLTFPQRQKLKLLAQKTGQPIGRVDVPASLTYLKDAAAKAGGQPPLPAPPSTHDLDLLLAKDGPERDAPVADQIDDLLARLQEWQGTAQRIPQRMAEWQEAQNLLREARHLPAAAAHAATLKAIEDNRSLLQDPNPVTAVLADLREELRRAVLEAHQKAQEAREQAVAELQRNPHWSDLGDDERVDLLQRFELEPQPQPDLADNTALLKLLDDTGLEARQRAAPAVVGFAQQAAKQINARFAPQAITVSVPKRLITSESELEDYLGEVRRSVAEGLNAGHEVNIT